mmetsp:Transcript_60487/g.187365  ORF Transcript_60487/g.187365 Transcript_60487/m.187365 type:complete len:235 (+) Transcript_60487:567-1271(+)
MERLHHIAGVSGVLYLVRDGCSDPRGRLILVPLGLANGKPPREQCGRRPDTRRRVGLHSDVVRAVLFQAVRRVRQQARSRQMERHWQVQPVGRHGRDGAAAERAGELPQHAVLHVLPPGQAHGRPVRAPARLDQASGSERGLAAVESERHLDLVEPRRGRRRERRRGVALAVRGRRLLHPAGALHGPPQTRESADGAPAPHAAEQLRGQVQVHVLPRQPRRVLTYLQPCGVLEG